MSEYILTLPHSPDDTLVITDRPEVTATERFRALPEGMNGSHVTVVRAHTVRSGDVVVGYFSEGPGLRRMMHTEAAFAAAPSDFGYCPLECYECTDTVYHAYSSDRFIRLISAGGNVKSCDVVFRNEPVAIVPGDVAAQFPPLDSAPPLPALFTIVEQEWGPYEALPVSSTWGPFQNISVTRATAEQIASDLPNTYGGRYLRCEWLHDALLISSDPRLRTDPGRPGHLIRPDADGRYRIGGLWEWWPVE
ncbi:hypothetical protein ABT024_05195 [Streptomyces sp. NPDC002812]|uniref:hypothetical protein n=1 Tax=Streptomyces sp. NPDC002812 TaxID=3154434 RepID=UPI003322BCE2